MVVSGAAVEATSDSGVASGTGRVLPASTCSGVRFVAIAGAASGTATSAADGTIVSADIAGSTGASIAAACSATAASISACMASRLLAPYWGATDICSSASVATFGAGTSAAGVSGITGTITSSGLTISGFGAICCPIYPPALPCCCCTGCAIHSFGLSAGVIFTSLTGSDFGGIFLFVTESSI